MAKKTNNKPNTGKNANGKPNSASNRNVNANANTTAKPKFNVLPLLAVCVVAISLVVVYAVNRQPSASGTSDGSSAGDTVVVGQGGSLEIPVSGITEEASFYPVEVDGTNMEILAVKASDGTIRTAFNTCQSCYTSGQGYYGVQDGELVCNNCGFHFTADEVEVSAGGCNPWPIYEEDKTVTDDTISISYDFLSASKDIFADWKKAS
ncbi:MAG: DUF2318 domain-containing protein [Blautia sp.]|nr:DUF2318 domain-containing protein [Blautia sp.]